MIVSWSSTFKLLIKMRVLPIAILIETGEYMVYEVVRRSAWEEEPIDRLELISGQFEAWTLLNESFVPEKTNKFNGSNWIERAWWSVEQGLFSLFSLPVSNLFLRVPSVLGKKLDILVAQCNIRISRACAAHFEVLEVFVVRWKWKRWTSMTKLEALCTIRRSFGWKCLPFLN